MLLIFFGILKKINGVLGQKENVNKIFKELFSVIITQYIRKS